MKKLKPCPFCGGDAYIAWAGDGIGKTFPNRPYVYFPTCRDPHCLGRNKNKHYNSREEAIEKWNTRRG